MKMQEEKLIEASLGAISSRVQEVKDSLQAFLAKLEMEQMNWPSMLDNFALLSGQVRTLTKLLKGDKTPLLRDLVLLPILVQQETDPDIQKATQGRIQAFNHEVVPDYLRTKYEPEVEEYEQKLVAVASNLNPDSAQRQITQFNDIIGGLTDMITNAKEEWEGEQNLAARTTPVANPDLDNLVAAITFGKGVKPTKAANSKSKSKGSPGTFADQGTSGWQGSKDQSGKMSSSVKNELKAVSSPHPYAARPPSRTGSSHS
ncbi:mediator of RNA polymerase II transcription subunit 8-A-like [Actinia tenebrosa]|uniref:Mediator of RNA polymerase II transcription subunit 8 n=1 Tax=Actinia tenebrosa TaxID=6105 RepID=A0A6P8J0F9_ACTTE|nr:mediator of RNA polymerase II transcription subunit 8-A-like [Actinia tenebrosa]